MDSPPTALALTAHDDDRSFRVRLDTTLAVYHPPPVWLTLLRAGLTALVVLFAPLPGAMLALAAVATWLLGGLVLRYPVRLNADRALFRGGLSNTSRPGLHWLRKRWRDTPHSIATTTLRLDWTPAPTRLQTADGETRWLSLQLCVWARPGREEADQFKALMQYDAWQTHPQALGRHLRREWLPLLVEAIASSDAHARARTTTVDVTREATSALDEAVGSFGWTLVELGECSAALSATTDDMQTEDRISIRSTEPPSRSASQ